jgi:hypothetical protein
MHREKKSMFFFRNYMEHINTILANVHITLWCFRLTIVAVATQQCFYYLLNGTILGKDLFNPYPANVENIVSS